MGTASFAVIAFAYAFFGATMVLGSIYLAKLFFTPKSEQIFFGCLLVVIAGIYLAFTAYFGDHAAWGLETAAVVVFAAFGLAGIQMPAVLMAGYALHGIWDIVHEFNAHAASLPWEFTPIPLAYGFLCLAYDLLIVAYFWTRRKEWQAAWSTSEAAASP